VELIFSNPPFQFFASAPVRSRDYNALVKSLRPPINARENQTMTLTLHADPLPLRVDEAGTVRVGDTRVTLTTVIQRFHQGDSPETLAKSFAPLLLADIYAVIGYYLRHRAEVDAYLLCEEREADVIREQHAQFFPDATAVRQRLQSRHEKGPTGDAPLAHG
jgi:uncharacterized protein (DUF433 family)